ncbi:hypothetical protein X975_03604, partial [Stegodyphus mimosarum]
MIRIRVPLVRPLVRCTFKRILRVLPSVLLLLFVFSLIFVTLMQIAVIHSHRRTHYVPIRHDSLNVTIFPPTGHTVLGVPNLQLPSSATKSVPHKRPDTLRVEAFLDKAAPTLEANVAIVKNMVNCVRVRKVLQSLSGGLTTRTRVHVIPKWIKDTIAVSAIITRNKTNENCCPGNRIWKRRRSCPLMP